MKNDQYIPHEVSMRSNSQVINLIEAEGAAGYGFYWALLEYLRAQNHYIGDIRAIKTIARQMKIRIDKAIRVLNDYGLFVVENTLFSSPMLVEKMRPLERKRAKVCHENDVSVSEVSCNSLEINDAFLKEEKRIEEKKKEEKTTTSSSSKEDAAAADDDVIKQPWESHIVSPSEAKKYFCFYLAPGSTPYQKLMLHLKQTEAKDVYRFEQRNPNSGERSYCGIPIPHDAPHRANDQAVWNEETGKWVY